MRVGLTRLIVTLFYSIIVLIVLISVSCGGGGGGGSAATTPTEAPPITTTVPPTPTTSDALLGNFKFVYKIVTIWTDRITLNTKSNQKTSDGTYIYTGYDATYPSVTAAAGAWYPSLSKYLIVNVSLNSTFIQGYTFSINADNTLPGCWMMSSNSGATWSNCYSFIIPTSRKTSLGSWEIAVESENDNINIDEVFVRKMAEDQVIQTQQVESVAPVNGDLVSKIYELKVIIENHR